MSGERVRNPERKWTWIKTRSSRQKTESPWEESTFAFPGPNFQLLYWTCHTAALNEIALNKTNHEQNRLRNELSARPNLTEVKNREHSKAGTTLYMSPVNDPSIGFGPGRGGIKRYSGVKKLMYKYSVHSWNHYHVLRHTALMKMYRLNLMNLQTESLPHLY